MTFKISTISISKRDAPSRYNVVLESQEKQATVNLWFDAPKASSEMPLGELEGLAKLEAAKLTQHN